MYAVSLTFATLLALQEVASRKNNSKDLELPTRTSKETLDTEHAAQQSQQLRTEKQTQNYAENQMNGSQINRSTYLLGDKTA